MTWIPLRDGQCWRKNSRCFNPQPVSELVGRRPDMEGAISAYEFHTAEDEAFHSKLTLTIVFSHFQLTVENSI